MSDITKEQAQPALIKVKLKKAHTHAGVDYEAGKDIEVTPAQADWLKAQGVI